MQTSAHASPSSYSGAVSPASLTIAFVLSSSEPPSHVCLLFVSSCCVEYVSLSPYQCPFDNELSQFRRQVLEHIDCLRSHSPAQFDADRLDRVRAYLILVPVLLRLLTFLACPPVLADPSMFCQSCWPPDCDVQPLQLVRTWNRGNCINSRNSDLFRSAGLCIASTTAVRLSPGQLWHPSCDVVSQGCLGLCRGSVFSTDFFGTQVCGHLSRF